MFLFNDGLSLTISRLSLISNKYLLFSWAKTLKLSKEDKKSQWSKWSQMALLFDSLTFFPVSGDTPMVYTLVYRCFHICSNWTQFHTELILLKGIFQKNSYPKNFIDKCFKKFLNNAHLVKENVPTVEKKRLLLALPYLGIISAN